MKGISVILPCILAYFFYSIPAAGENSADKKALHLRIAELDKLAIDQELLVRRCRRIERALDHLFGPSSYRGRVISIFPQSAYSGSSAASILCPLTENMLYNEQRLIRSFIYRRMLQVVTGQRQKGDEESVPEWLVAAIFGYLELQEQVHLPYQHFSSSALFMQQQRMPPFARIVEMKTAIQSPALYRLYSNACVSILYGLQRDLPKGRFQELLHLLPAAMPESNRIRAWLRSAGFKGPDVLQSWYIQHLARTAATPCFPISYRLVKNRIKGINTLVILNSDPTESDPIRQIPLGKFGDLGREITIHQNEIDRRILVLRRLLWNAPFPLKEAIARYLSAFAHFKSGRQRARFSADIQKTELVFDKGWKEGMAIQRYLDHLEDNLFQYSPLRRLYLRIQAMEIVDWDTDSAAFEEELHQYLDQINKTTVR